MKWGPQPVLVLGHGIRMAHAEHLVPALLDLGIPVLTSWQAIDLVDNRHPSYFGRPGLYGQRCANKILREAGHIVAIGCRLPIWMVGFEGFPWDARLTVCDIDPAEIVKHPRADAVLMDAGKFMQELIDGGPVKHLSDWFYRCGEWAEERPWVEYPTHNDTLGHINSYAFMGWIQRFFTSDQVIVTDMGTALISAHQVLKLCPPQRLMTSGGLGEMGCALPAAIGASFAREKGEVLCLHCDGGMMMNLQELQTIIHHQLPIKIIVFENDGYLMIKKTQGVMGLKTSGVNAASGVSTPNFRRLAQGMGMRAAEVWTWEDAEKAVPVLFSLNQPGLVEVHIDPMQPLVPKLNPVMVDGKPTAPDFADLSPRLG